MWERDKIPGFAEAQDSEQRDRALAFLGLPEVIAGGQFNPLTPTIIERLVVARNPFLCGGKITEAAVLQYLWHCSPDYVPIEKKMLKWIRKFGRIVAMGFDEDVVAIEASIDRAFLDSPYGASGAPYCSLSADLVTAMADEPFRWPMEKTMATPVAISYQLCRCRLKAKGGVIINRRSDEITAQWMDGLPVLTADTRKALHDLILKAMDELGLEPCSEPSQSKDKTWSITMRKKEAVNG